MVSHHNFILIFLMFMFSFIIKINKFNFFFFCSFHFLVVNYCVSYVDLNLSMFLLKFILVSLYFENPLVMVIFVCMKIPKQKKFCSLQVVNSNNIKAFSFAYTFIIFKNAIGLMLHDKRVGEKNWILSVIASSCCLSIIFIIIRSVNHHCWFNGRDHHTFIPYVLTKLVMRKL